jgi:hypothetical protein
MAQHPDWDGIAVEGLGGMEPVVVSRRVINGRPAFVIACEDNALRWLSTSFEALGQRTPFHLGDLSPACDSPCVITVATSQGANRAAMTSLEDGVFRWLVPAAQARRFADLIAAMADSQIPCHQYLETEPGLPVVVVTKGEYPGQTPRWPRLDRP